MDDSTIDYDALNDAIDKRFPNAKFIVSCFGTVEEIETKTLTEDNIVLYEDEYAVSVYNPKTKQWKKTEQYYDRFLIKKKEGQTHIRHCDVIDQLIEFGFERKCDHNFMENIRMSPFSPRNENSLKRCDSFWGS